MVRKIMIDELQEAVNLKAGAAIASYNAKGKISCSCGGIISQEHLWVCPHITIDQDLKARIDRASLGQLKWLIKRIEPQIDQMTKNSRTINRIISPPTYDV